MYSLVFPAYCRLLYPLYIDIPLLAPKGGVGVYHDSEDETVTGDREDETERMRQRGWDREDESVRMRQ